MVRIHLHHSTTMNKETMEIRNSFDAYSQAQEQLESRNFDRMEWMAASDNLVQIQNIQSCRSYFFSMHYSLMNILQLISYRHLIPTLNELLLLSLHQRCSYLESHFFTHQGYRINAIVITCSCLLCSLSLNANYGRESPIHNLD